MEYVLYIYVFIKEKCLQRQNTRFTIVIFVHISYLLQVFARGLLYLETHLRSSMPLKRYEKPDETQYKQDLENNLGFLQELYALLESPDGKSYMVVFC